jgi:hypothetical protein
LNSSKKVSFDEDQLKITKESITELNNLSYQLTEYNTTVLNYDHTQNRVPSFVRGNVALIEQPKNIATNKQVDKQNTSNIINAQQIFQSLPYSTDVERITKPIILESIDSSRVKKALVDNNIQDSEKNSVKMGNSDVKYLDENYQVKRNKNTLMVWKDRVINWHKFKMYNVDKTNKIDPETLVVKCLYCQSWITKNGLRRHKIENKYCLYKQNQIIYNELEIMNETKSVKILLEELGIWNDNEANSIAISSDLINCDCCDQTFKSEKGKHVHFTTQHNNKKQKKC